ncbi:Spo0B domain-containing protein [Paenibacillus sp. HB172176]|uniref:Spo0B domain-containing protein n=1 Tax=Paenibacillus sp. HB172176 TaxID=2493690 RepID=UPI00143B46B5|nr:Spo0B domain-containing protein [Paenibacillus sp. HB172176]
MGRLKAAKHYAAASILVPMIALILWHEQLWSAVLFMIWLAAAAVLWILSERREQKDRLSRTIQSMQSAGIRTLNHHRHDWMNDLQVLYGYARMGKLEKTIPFMEKIVAKMGRESSIAKLGNPALIGYIQSFRTLTNSLVLEVDIEGELNLNEQCMNGDKIAETLIHTINAYRFSMNPGSYEQAILRLELSADDEALTAAFYYEGELINEQQWKQKISKQLEGAPLQVVGSEHSSSKMLLKAEMRA